MRRNQISRWLSCGIFHLHNSLSAPVPSLRQYGYCTVSYVSDVEGNIEYWERFLNISEVLKRNDNKVELKDNCMFVFGGDVCDRGPGDIRFLTDLLQLKKDYPSRVHFIIGNRDVNKLRLPFELNIKKMLHQDPHTWWSKKPVEQPGAGGESEPHDGVQHLKWILARTMGAPDSFAHRKLELQQIRRKLLSGGRAADAAVDIEVEDAEVVQSFVDLVSTRGLLTQYLQHAQVCLSIGDVLFVHGGLHAYNLGAVPPYADRPAVDSLAVSGVADVQQWIKDINAFARYEMLDYVKRCEEYIRRANEEDEERQGQGEGQGEGGATVAGQSSASTPVPHLWSHSGGYQHPQPGSRLVQSGMAILPDSTTNPTPVYSSYMKGGKPSLPDADTLRCLSRHGVHRVVVGHQPIGDMPVILRAGTAEHPLQILCCDTSYSADVVWEGTGGGGGEDQRSPPTPTQPMRCSRGVAVSELLLHLSESRSGSGSGRSTGRLHGTLSNGRSYEQQLPPPEDQDALVGTQLSDSRLVRAGPFPLQALMDIAPVSSLPTELAGCTPTTGAREASSSTSPPTAPSHGVYLVSRHEGFAVANEVVSEDVVRAMLRSRHMAD